MGWLETRISERILLTHITSFESVLASPAKPQNFFDELFAKLGFPFLCFIDEEQLIAQHKHFEPGLMSYDSVDAARFFSASSIGFKTFGSRNYCLWYSSVWLRTLLDLLRIASYIHPGQRSFGWDVKMTGPTFPVFLGDHAAGVLKYDEDRKEQWAKIPDGCLFLSFGYRGLSKMQLDNRTFTKLENFIRDHKAVFDCLKNPWNAKSIFDIAPSLDILSSATQIPSLGAKILLVYCCLEHLFVPGVAKGENKKYIIGGLNALGPELLPWFYELYDLRCSYAHKGFVRSDDRTMVLIAESMKNAMKLLVRKLSIP
jgi:hypothetical protein